MLDKLMHYPTVLCQLVVLASTPHFDDTSFVFATDISYIALLDPLEGS